MAKKLGLPLDVEKKTWVQTDRSAHEAWARLARKAPIASALMHIFVGSMGHQNAVVVSQKILAKMLECSLKSVQRALDLLDAEQWIQIVNMGGSGTVNAYVVNDQVAWGEKRANMQYSTFSARVIADIDDQSEHQLNRSGLRRIPTLYPNEFQLPTGKGEAPPSQPLIDGFEPDLPSLIKKY
ncbi:MAG: helix-turn-helix domain-containing protein [bacterium]|nr:helix-turn-helix domain-containing protein [bacterium]